VPLTTLCAWLNPSQFIRVHRSIVVATRMIRDLEPSGHGEYEIRLLSGIQLTTGRTYHAQIRKLTQNPVGRS
jgi:two-component system LytT family response regulator